MDEWNVNERLSSGIGFESENLRALSQTTNYMDVKDGLGLNLSMQTEIMPTLHTLAEMRMDERFWLTPTCSRLNCPWLYIVTSPSFTAGTKAYSNGAKYKQTKKRSIGVEKK